MGTCIDSAFDLRKQSRTVFGAHSRKHLVEFMPHHLRRLQTFGVFLE